MGTDNLQRWALIAEIVGGIAVVLSLIFVGLEIRQSSEETLQNTRALEVSAYQDLISQISTMNMLIIEDPSFAELYDRMIQGENPQNATERRRIDAFFILTARHGDMAFRQYENGLIDERSLNSVLTPLVVFVIQMQEGLPSWYQLENALNPAYVDYVNRRIELTELDENGMPVTR